MVSLSTASNESSTVELKSEKTLKPQLSVLYSSGLRTAASYQDLVYKISSSAQCSDAARGEINDPWSSVDIGDELQSQSDGENATD